MPSTVTATSREVVPAKTGNVTPTTTKPPPTQGANNPSVSNPNASSVPGNSNRSRPVSSLAPSFGKVSTSGPTDTIIVSTVVIIGTALIKDTAHGSPSIKPVVTGMMLGAALLVLGTFAPTFAKLLAITGLVGAIMTNGPAVFNVAEKIK